MTDRIERSNLHQKAVLWTFAGYDNDGAPLVAAPVEIKVRWVAGRREALGPDAAPIAVDVGVTATRSIPLNSLMRLGKLSDVPSPPDFLFEVLTCNETPDIRNRATFYYVTLARYTGSLTLA